MKRLFMLAMSLVLLNVTAVRAQDMLSIDSVVVLLNSEMRKGNYERARIYVQEIIQRNEAVSNLTLLNCADCLIMCKDYTGCIKFCDNWKKLHEQDEDFFPAIFDASYGECYYFMEDYATASNFLTNYYTRAEENGFNLSFYYLGIYASSLHGSYQFPEADSIYSRYLNEVIRAENLTLETLSNSEYRSSIGYKIYEWAYNSIYQADEVTGLELLKLAAECGNDEALADYKILSQSSTFAKTPTYKKKIIREFERYITELGLRQLDMSEQVGFWYDVQNTNVKYKELQEALGKQKRSGTLEKVLNEMGSNRSFVDSKLAEFYPYSVGDFEKSLDIRLCGENTFLREIRVYPASNPNAFATPFGQVYLTEGLVRLYHFNKNLLIGICAHEATHYLCQHSMVGLWEQKKKEKKNKIWAGIAVGLNTVAQVSTAMYAASAGVEYSQDYWDSWANNVTSINNGFIQAFREDAYYFQFKYGRKQEIEADLMAYRFCESIGLGGYAYILALELLGDKQGYLKPDKTSDHPTNAYRIGLLKHLYSLEHKTFEQ